MMNQSTILLLSIAFLSIAIVSGTNICDNAPCEPQINASLGKEFTISLESNPSTGFEWWTKFDPNYLILLNSTFMNGNEKSGMVGVPGKQMFSFNAKSVGNTEVIMLLLRPLENGTIAERKIFPISIASEAAASNQPIMLGKSLGGTTGQTTTTPHDPRSDYGKDESVMETPLQASAHRNR
jgi:inhibitor of cysteine peptidase